VCSSDLFSFTKSDWQVPEEWHKDESLPNAGIYTVLFGECVNKVIESNLPTSESTESSDSVVVFTQTDTFSDIEEEEHIEDLDGAYNDRYNLQACFLSQKNNGNNITITTAVELMASNEFHYTL
jgi:hypothetical protein